MYESPRRREISESSLDFLIWIGIFLLIFYRLYVLYFPFKLFGYLVPPGNDPVVHYEMIKRVLSGDFNIQYPLLFHTLVAYASRITSIDPITIMKSIGPILVVLPPIAIYIFLKNNFGRLVGLVGVIISLLATNYGLLAFADGNYPNMISGGFLMPLTLMFLVFAANSKKISNYFWGLVLALIMVATHQLTMALFVLILIIFTTIMLIWNANEPGFKGVRRLGFFTIGFLVVLTLIVLASPLKSFFTNVFHLVLSGGFVDDVAYIKPISFSEYQHAVGSFVWSGGLISIIYLIFLLGKKREEENKAAILLVLVWFAVCFLLSRMSVTGVPARFAREMAIPLIMAISISIVAIIRQNGNIIQKILASGFFGFIIVLNLVQVNGGAFSSPTYFNSMIWFSSQDKEKTDFIKLATAPEDIIASNRTTPYLPVFAGREVLFNLETNLSKNNLDEYLKKMGAKYLFIGLKTGANPSGEVYPFFRDFDKTTEALTAVAKKNKYEVAHTFADGSVLYRIDSNVSE